MTKEVIIPRCDPKVNLVASNRCACAGLFFKCYLVGKALVVPGRVKADGTLAGRKRIDSLNSTYFFISYAYSSDVSKSL